MAPGGDTPGGGRLHGFRGGWFPRERLDSARDVREPGVAGWAHARRSSEDRGREWGRREGDDRRLRFGWAGHLGHRISAREVVASRPGVASALLVGARWTPRRRP